MTYLPPTSTTSSPPNEEAEKQKRHFLNIFRRVMTLYDDYKAVQGTSSNTGSTGASANDSTGNGDGVITMSPSDFICDVETSARRGLTEPELAFFDHVYKLKDEGFVAALTERLGDLVYARVKQRVQVKLGQVFKERGVFPTKEYFRPIDVR